MADGAPLLSLRQMPFAYQSMRPMQLNVYEDRVECRTPGAITRGTTKSIRYEQIAQVVVDRRAAWSSLAVETTGGGGFEIHGLSKSEADAAKATIDERVAGLRRAMDDADTANLAIPSVADQLTQLSRLRESGALTEDEFAAAKARVLGGESA